MSRSSPRKTAILAVIVMAALGLLGSEALVRLAFPHSSPDTLRRYSVGYEASAYTRIRLAPVGSMVEADAGKARGEKPASAPSDHTFYINDLGFRGPPFHPVKPPGRLRVFVMGGSAVFDQNVSDRSAATGGSWPNRAGALLRQRGIDVEVINGGTPSHSTTDVLGRLISEIWIYQPDVVVLYNGWNDIKNFRAWEITPDAPLSRVIAPFHPGSDPFRYHTGPVDRLLGHSQLYMKFRDAYHRARSAVGVEGYLADGEVGSGYGPWGLRQYEQNVEHFVDIVQNMGARPVLTTQAASPDTAALRAGGTRYQLLEPRALATAYEDIHGVTRAVAEAHDVPLLDAAAVLGEDARDFSDHVHFSARGSEAMAGLLAGFLAPLLTDPEV